MKIIIACLLFLALSFLAFSQNADINLLKSINLNRNRNFDSTFRLITNSVSPISVGFSVLVLSIGLIKKDSAIRFKGIFIAGTILVASLTSTILKYSVNRPRPFVTHSFIEKITLGGNPSFPSGHTSDAFAIATSLSIAFPKWYVIAPTFLWAGFVGYSRMDLGVHYPSDVLAGALVGTGSAFLCMYIISRPSLNSI
jgi:membrane-associated phospholipid phosphatase